VFDSIQFSQNMYLFSVNLQNNIKISYYVSEFNFMM